jgi:hypothetical protein
VDRGQSEGPFRDLRPAEFGCDLRTESGELPLVESEDPRPHRFVIRCPCEPRLGMIQLHQGVAVVDLRQGEGLDRVDPDAGDGRGGSW